MARKLWLIALASLYLLSPAAALAGGDIYVGGPYGTKITSLPYTISAPGAYYLASNLTYSGNDTGISIYSDHVTLDLMGFTITGSGSGFYGILIFSLKNVEIRNGSISGWIQGINGNGNNAAGYRISNVRMVGNRAGIWLGGDGHLIQGCEVTVTDTGQPHAIWVGGSATISGCMVSCTDWFGIYSWGGIISGNVVSGNGLSGGGGIYARAATLVMGNAVRNCATGIQCDYAASVIGNTVNTSSSSQTGISAINSNIYPTLMDQNTVTGPGTHYSWGSGTVAWRNNAGYP
jgi:hypothetical protein